MEALGKQIIYIIFAIIFIALFFLSRQLLAKQLAEAQEETLSKLARAEAEARRKLAAEDEKAFIRRALRTAPTKKLSEGGEPVEN